MRIQPLYDLQQEINRLFIAGSKFAKNDPRLQKLVPVFEKLGEKAPVFKKLASDIDELTKADASGSSDKLSAISTLLYSVLYTQGEMTEVDVEKKDQAPHFDIKDITTLYSYLELKPSIQALSESNQGRMEVVRDAHERGIFKDFRTYGYLNKALGDKYSELAVYVEDIIRKDAGKTIVPLLLESFNYEGRSEDARRLSLLHHFGYEGVGDMIKNIMSGSSENLQIEAIRILSEDLVNEDLIIELTGDKKKGIRSAAYMGIAHMNTEKSQNKLKELYIKNKKNKTNLELLIEALQESKFDFIFDEMLEQIRASFNDLLSLDESADNKFFVEAVKNLQAHIGLLNKKNRPEVYQLLSDIVTSKELDKLIKGKINLLSGYTEYMAGRIIDVLYSLDRSKVLPFLEKVIGEMTAEEWKKPLYQKYLIESVVNGYSPSKVYDIFIKPYENKYIEIDDLILAYSNNPEARYASVKDIKDVKVIDKRWFEFFYKQEFKKDRDADYITMLQLLDVYEEVPSEKFNKLLISVAPKIEVRSVADVFEIIMKREIPDRFEFIYSLIEVYNSKKLRYYEYYRLTSSDFWKDFPKEYAKRFKDMAVKQKNNLFDEIVEKIEGGRG